MTISSQRRPSPFLAQVWHFLKSWDFGWLGSGFGTLPGRPLVFKHREKRPSGWGVECFDPWNPILHLFSKTMGKHQPPKSRKNIKLFCRWRIQEVLLKDVVIQKSCHWKEKAGAFFVVKIWVLDQEWFPISLQGSNHVNVQSFYVTSPK